jgi:hypothetical protein
MKRSLIGCAILLAVTMGLVPSLWKQADGCFAVSPRSGSRWLRTPIEINTESALIIWDAETQTQHFIRKAGFETAAKNFGFLVPTPTKPELAEAKEAVFGKLASITAPPARRFGHVQSKSFGRPAPSSPPPAVTVLEAKQVAGFDAAVLAATDPQALNDWLRKHDYESGPELAEWLKPYIDQAWIITAFKIANSQPAAATLGSTAVRMSFHTDRPFFPYREPAPKSNGPLVGEDVIVRQPGEAQEIIRMPLARVSEQQRQIAACEATLACS